MHKKRIGLSSHISTATERMEVLLAPNYPEKNGEYYKDESENIYLHKVSPEYIIIL